MSGESVPRKTLAREGTVSGIGLHTGKPCTLLLKPASAGAGLRFLKHGRPVEGFSADPRRCSAIGEGEDRILTVEHFLAALGGAGITDLVIDVQGSEIPGLDGSALPFVKLFKELGIIEQAGSLEVYRIAEPIFCYDNYDKQKAIAIHPGDGLRVSYLLDHEHPELRGQKVDLALTPESFESQIAPARTFCTDREVKELQKSGFGLGGSPKPGA